MLPRARRTNQDRCKPLLAIKLRLHWHDREIGTGRLLTSTTISNKLNHQQINHHENHFPRPPVCHKHLRLRRRFRAICVEFSSEEEAKGTQRLESMEQTGKSSRMGGTSLERLAIWFLGRRLGSQTNSAASQRLG